MPIRDQRWKDNIRRMLESSGAGRLLNVWRAVRNARHNLKSPTRVFREIYRQNEWADPQSVSGTGSNVQSTVVVRAALQHLLTERRISTLLDAPCGDFNWMRLADLRSV